MISSGAESQIGGAGTRAPPGASVPPSRGSQCRVPPRPHGVRPGWPPSSTRANAAAAHRLMQNSGWAGRVGPNSYTVRGATLACPRCARPGSRPAFQGRHPQHTNTHTHTLTLNSLNANQYGRQAARHFILFAGRPAECARQGRICFRLADKGVSPSLPQWQIRPCRRADC